MAKGSVIPGWQRALIILTWTVTGTIALLVLYVAQVIFIPVAMAIFLTFILGPAVNFFQRRGLGRIGSVGVVVLVAGLLLMGLAWLVTAQVAGLIQELPQHAHNIKQKIVTVREFLEGSGEWGNFVEDLVKTAKGKKGLDAEPAANPDVPVVVASESSPFLGGVVRFLDPLMNSLGGLALALLLLVFMLMKKEDLRNRIIRLIGYGRVTMTTKAVDDAGRRISRFLIMQAIVNGTYGMAVTLGFFVIGVPYALLWGFLAAILRYIPYIGAWIAAVLPILMSLAIFESWTQPLLVIGLFLVLELISNNLMEPLLYGHSIGVSEVALIVMAAFWGYLWGLIGMVLSSPLTVCLVVLGRYVPHLQFLEVLLGDEPALEPKVNLYQRLLARDQDEAADIVLTQIKTAPLVQVLDEVMIPALVWVKRDHDQSDITDADQRYALDTTREIVEDLAEVQNPTEKKEGSKNDEKTETDWKEIPGVPLEERVKILAIPARNEHDQLCLEMLGELLDSSKWEVAIASVEALSSEVLERVEKFQPGAVVIGSVPPGGLAHTRYLCKRLRARFPRLKILVGRWGLETGLERNRERLAQAGADLMETTLAQTVAQLRTMLPVLSQKQPQLEEEDNLRWQLTAV